MARHFAQRAGYRARIPVVPPIPPGRAPANSTVRAAPRRRDHLSLGHHREPRMGGSNTSLRFPLALALRRQRPAFSPALEFPATRMARGRQSSCGRVLLIRPCRLPSSVDRGDFFSPARTPLAGRRSRCAPMLRLAMRVWALRPWRQCPPLLWSAGRSRSGNRPSFEGLLQTQLPWPRAHALLHAGLLSFNCPGPLRAAWTPSKAVSQQSQWNVQAPRARPTP